MRRQILLTIVFHFILCTGYVEPKEKFVRKDTKGLEYEPISEEKLASLRTETIKDSTPSETLTGQNKKGVKDDSTAKETLDSLPSETVPSYPVKDTSTGELEVESQDDVILEQSSLGLPLEKVDQDHNTKLESLEKGNTVDGKEPVSTKQLDSSHTKQNGKYVKKGHILFFHNAGTRSHLIALNALAEGLVEHGHRVTSVQYMKSNIRHENYTEVLIQDK